LKKPGFLGVRVDGMSVLAPPRNRVGKKPGFSLDVGFSSPQKPGWQKTGFLNRWDVGFSSPQKPGWQKTGFQIGCRF
jgi:hypothetical protein